MAKIGEATTKFIRLYVKSVHGRFEQFALFSSERLEAAAFACVEQCFAEEFPVSSVNERMRRQNLREIRKRLSGSKKKTAALEFIPLLLKVRLNTVDDSICETSCFGAHERDEAASFGWRSFSRGVIGLTKFIRESFDEVRTLTQKDQRGALFKRERDERGPAGMGAKTKGGMLHRTPARAIRVRGENNTKDAHQQRSCSKPVFP